MKTVRLYYENQYTRRFTARVVSCTAADAGWLVALDQTAFFPEGGGQSADTGVLGSARVTDVQSSDGLILHRTDSPLPVGADVAGQLDWGERFRKMQTHSGEHIVSGLVHSRFGYENVGFHLGADGCTFDYNGELTRQQLDELEDAANAVVWENRPITARFPDHAELETLDYRSKLDLHEDVRIVTVEGIDICACCAPHVARTGEIGAIKLLDFMRHRGGVRIWAKCGSDALRDHRARYAASAAVSAVLNVPQANIAEAAQRLAAQRDELSRALAETRKAALAAQAAALSPTPGHLVVFADADDAGLRALANAGMERCGGVCAVFSGSDGAYLFVMGSETLDMRAFMRENAAALSARGGGQSRMVSGRSTATRAALEAFFVQA